MEEKDHEVLGPAVDRDAIAHDEVRRQADGADLHRWSNVCD